MNTSGPASARQVLSGFKPIPGSISTGTAPALNRAKNRAKNSSEGGTMKATRVPFLMPRA